MVRELQGDLATLKSVALSCRYFRQKVRAVLFRRIHLYLHPRVDGIPAEDKIDLLAHCRHLLPHIQHVEIFGVFNEIDDEDGEAATPIPHDAEALRVLMNLPYISSIRITGYPTRQWAEASRSVRGAVMTALRKSKFLNRLEVLGIHDFPAYLLEGCLSLKHLSLTPSFSCRPEKDIEIVAHRTMLQMLAHDEAGPIRLENLSLKCATTNLVKLAQWLLLENTALDISQLKKLEIRMTGAFDFNQRQQILNIILEKCSETLEELALDIFSPGPFALSPRYQDIWLM